jgi:hypothetical protein
VQELTCAQIVWAETKDIAANTEDSKRMLRELRAHIAALAVEGEGAGLPNRAPLPVDGEPATRDAVQDCLSVANAAVAATRVLPASRILIWYGAADSPTPQSSPAKPPSPWDKINPALLTPLGPFSAGDQRIRAFLCAPPDAESLKPFISIVSGAGLPASMRTVVSKAATHKTVADKARLWGYICAATSLLLFIIAAAWALNVGSVARTTYDVFRAQAQTGCGPVIPATGALSNFTLPADWLTKPSDIYDGHTPIDLSKRQDCAGKWAFAQREVFRGTDDADAWTGMWRSLVRHLSATPGQLSLRLPMAGVMISLLLLIIAAGLGVLGRPLGILIDPRNRMSLTRAQLALWTIILIGGWATLGLFNIGFSATDFRNMGQLVFDEARRLQDATGAASPIEELAKRLFVFPSMDWPLWALLGISIGSPALSALILRPGLGDASKINAMEQPKRNVVLTKQDPDDAELSDLVYGETADNENVVDATRVQHVGITAVLAAAYTHELFQSGLAIDGLRAVRAVELPAPVFASLPPISETFLALLVITHGALLIGKYYQGSGMARSTA